MSEIAVNIHVLQEQEGSRIGLCLLNRKSFAEGASTRKATVRMGNALDWAATRMEALIAFVTVSA
jgi:hypothetical protein